MIVFLGVAGAVFLVVAVIGIMYFAGNRGKSQDIANREAAAKGHNQSAAKEPARSEGRGDL